MNGLARSVLGTGFLFALATSAWAVGAVGTPVRVDQDPGTSVYKLGNIYNVVRTPVGGFAVGWEEDNNSVTGTDRVRFRVFRANGTAVAAPGAANVSGRIIPGLARITALGTSSLYLAYSASQPPPALDEPGKREGFGQTISASTGATVGARSLLNTTSTNEGGLALRSSSLSDGRAVAAWYDDANFGNIRGRFISPAGVPQAVNLQLGCCSQSQLVSLDALGTGFLASYRRISLFNSINELYGRVFKSNGTQLGPPKKLAIGNDLLPGLRALVNGKILFFHTVGTGAARRVVGQLYSQTWQAQGTEKTLIGGLAAGTNFVLASTPDGGVLISRTQKTGSNYSYVIRRFGPSLTPVGATYTFAAEGPDNPRMVAFSANRGVVMFKRTVAGRSRLLAQIISF